VRQPVSPEEGTISVALTEGGTYWTLVLLGCKPPHLALAAGERRDKSPILVALV
jgi:hypothetical protein